MKTVSKALSLLQQFSVSPEPKSLGAIAAEARLDKATTRRMLVSMCEFGLMEQDPHTRVYSLGAAILPLARAREALRPLMSVVEPLVQQVSMQTGETTHFSVPAQNALSVLCVAESPKSIRVHIKPGSLLPLHTSGAGIAYLSASGEDVLAGVVSSGLPGTTSYSLTTPQMVKAAVEDARALGYAKTEQIHEEDVCGISIPVCGGTGAIAGVIGVATPIQRMSDAARTGIVDCLTQSANNLSLVL